MKVAELQEMLTKLPQDAEVKAVGETADEYAYLLIQGRDRDRGRGDWYITEEIVIK